MAGLGYTLVDFGSLERAINQLKMAKEHLGSQLNRVRGTIDGSVNNEQIYLSKDARVTKERFDQMFDKWARKFDGYVQEYIDYFEKAKATYESRAETEASTAQRLNSFID